MSQTGFTPISLYYSTTAAAAPSAGNLANGELAVNITDGKLFYKDNGGVVRVLATAAGSAGDVVGPGSSTDNALVRFDGTTGKLVQNSSVVLDDSGNLTGLASVTATTLTGALTGSVGATTPNTGAFTTLSASGAVTLSGGTANGVAYLNGSKVLTTGSALTFDGVNLFNDQSTASPIGIRLRNGSASTSAGTRVAFEFGGSTTGYVGNQFDGSDFNTQYMAAQHHIWLRGASEQMRLTSTGLGIGTSSPGAKLHVDGGSIAPTSGSVARFDTTATTAYSSGGFVGGQLRLNYGNATNSYGGINFSNFGATAQEFFGVVQNSGGQGSFVWQGFNGSAYAERMRLDSSGNLGLGVTPSAWGGWKAFEFSNGKSLAGFGSGGALALTQNTFFNGSNWIYKGSAVASLHTLESSGSFAWFTAPSGTAGNAISFTQAMTLDSDGLLALGTTSPASATRLTLDYPGFVQMVMRSSGTDRISLYGDASVSAVDAKANPLALYAGSAERARIDSSGNLLVGTTSLITDANCFNYSPGNTWGIFGHGTGVASGTDYVKFRYGSSQIGSITQSGTTAVLYNTTSDQRLKENIADADSASALIDSLQVRKYDWKSDGSHQRYGFVAQELVTVAPEAVHQPEDPEAMMAVDYSKLVPMLVKEIQSLRQRLAAAGIA